MRTIRHHYPVWPVDTPEIVLRGIGIHEKMRPGTVKRPRGIDTFLFVYFYTEAWNTVGIQTTRIPANSIVIWRPNTPHDFGNREREWDHTWMLAGGRLISREIERLRIPCETPLIAPVAGLMEKAMFETDQEALHPPADSRIVANLIQNFLIELSRVIEGGNRALTIPSEYIAVKRYMDDHFTEPLTLKQLAKMVHRSVPRFATRFKTLFGVPPLDYLIRLRMQRAEFLLHDQSYNIAEIGQAVGYPDPHYFSRLFRRRFGKSPKAARKR